MIAIGIVWFVLASWAAEPLPVELQGIGIEEKLGAQVPLDLQFADEGGQEVSLKSYLNGERPVILVLVYYECPNLCTFVLNGLVDSLKKLPWAPGKEFEVVAVSINDRETPEIAAQKKQAYLAEYGRVGAEKGWHFLTGRREMIDQLADSVGFQFRYDEKEKQFAHSAGIFVLTPTGRLSRVLFGIQYAPRDVKLALLEAGEGKIGTFIDRFLLFCYHYDPAGKKYALMATNIMKGAGGLTIVGLAFLIFGFLRRGKVNRTTAAS